MGSHNFTLVWTTSQLQKQRIINMSGSSISDSSYDSNNKVEELEAVFDDEEKENYVFNLPPRNRNLQKKPFLSRSVMNLGTATASLFSKSLNRSESSSTLASSIGSLSPVPVSDIKNLNDNYQNLLTQATRKIKKLNVDVERLEQEQEKLLQANVDLALETKNLLLDQKAWKKDEQALVEANEEFATEVDRLYSVEVEQVEEIGNLKNQLKEAEEKFLVDKSLLDKKHLEDQNKWEKEIARLTRIIAKKKLVEEELEGSIEYIRSAYASDRVKFEAKIDALENTLAKEQELREEGEGDLSKTKEELEALENALAKEQELRQEGEGDLRKAKEELEALSSKYQENLVNIEAEVAKLMEEKDKLKSANLELAAENIQLKTDQDEKEQTWRREMSQLSLDNQLLQNNLKMLNEKNEKEMEKVKKELKDESERVKQLNIHTKMVTAENEWLKKNLNTTEENHEEDRKTKNDLLSDKEKTKNLTSWKFWKPSE